MPWRRVAAKPPGLDHQKPDRLHLRRSRIEENEIARPRPGEGGEDPGEGLGELAVDLLVVNDAFQLDIDKGELRTRLGSSPGGGGATRPRDPWRPPAPLLRAPPPARRRGSPRRARRTPPRVMKSTTWSKRRCRRRESTDRDRRRARGCAGDRGCRQTKTGRPLPWEDCSAGGRGGTSDGTGVTCRGESDGEGRTAARRQRLPGGHHRHTRPCRRGAGRAPRGLRGLRNMEKSVLHSTFCQVKVSSSAFCAI
jgi:hypothetical protein